LTDFRKKLQILKIKKNKFVQSICSMRTDEKTDVTKLTVAFRNFAKAPNKKAFVLCNHIWAGRTLGVNM